MNLFQTAKQISCADAAKRLGLKGSGRKWCCPFHDDHNPSMHCFEDSRRFYCFSCNARGDAADLWAKVTGTNLREAAEQLCTAFGMTWDQAARPVEDGGERPPSALPAAPPEQKPQGSGERPPSGKEPRESGERPLAALPTEKPQGNGAGQLKEHVMDVLQLPQVVWKDWQRMMVALMDEEIGACTRLLEQFCDPESLMWEYMLRRAVELQDEVNRLRDVAPDDLREEINEWRRQQTNRKGVAGRLDAPRAGWELMERLLADRLRTEGLKMGRVEREIVLRTLDVDMKRTSL